MREQTVHCGVELDVPDIVAVARKQAPVALSASAAERIRRERAAVDRVIEQRIPTYGITTGLGARANYALPEQELAAFSLRTVRGRANSVGEPLPTEVVRAAMLIRLNSMALGGSGVNLAIAERLAGLLNAQVHPLVGRTGSIGAADLCQLAHIGLVVVGEGDAEYRGEHQDGAEALRRAGLTPLTLGPKDGLALCNANAVTAGTTALAMADAEDALLSAQAVATLTCEGFRANSSPLDARVQAARPAPGAQSAAGQLRAMLRGGALTDPAAARRVQDPISIRCVSQVHGALGYAMEFLRPALAAELGGAGDNPLVLDDGTVTSTGNFHTTALALALDAVALALCQTAALSAERMQRLLSDRLTDLPANLAPAGLASSGFAPLAKTAQALVTEIRQLASPVSVDSRTGADEVEDDASNAGYAARRLAEMVPRLRLVLAVEAVVAAQAVDLAAPETLGAGPALLQKAVRAVVRPLTEDRPCGPDVELVAKQVLSAPDLLASLRKLE